MDDTSFPAGSGGDIATRIFAGAAANELGKPVKVTNVTGGRGTIGAAKVVQARKDGYEMAAKKKVPIVEGLFTWPSDDPKIIASRCKKCGTVSFPKAPFCQNPDCEKVRENIEQIELNKRGNLWSYTFQRYQPPAPFRYEPFQPYALGMVDFPEGIRIWGIINGTENLEMGIKHQRNSVIF